VVEVERRGELAADPQQGVQVLEPVLVLLEQECAVDRQGALVGDMLEEEPVARLVGGSAVPGLERQHGDRAAVDLERHEQGEVGMDARGRVRGERFVAPLDPRGLAFGLGKVERAAFVLGEVAEREVGEARADLLLLRLVEPDRGDQGIRPLAVRVEDRARARGDAAHRHVQHGHRGRRRVVGLDQARGGLAHREHAARHLRELRVGVVARRLEAGDLGVSLAHSQKSARTTRA
jgi:hypothetical protein